MYFGYLNRISSILLTFLMLLGVALSGINPHAESVLPPTVDMGILGRIYENPSTATRPATIGEIVSWGNYLYVPCRYVNGDQKLETWNVRHPENPARIAVRSYGNIATNSTDHWKFPRLNIFDDVMVVRSDYKDYLYRIQINGSLIALPPLEGKDYSTVIGSYEGSGHMRSASGFGSYLATVAEPRTVPPEYEYQHILVSYHNPTKPFVLKSKLNPQKLVPFTTTPDYLNSQFRGYPAILRLTSSSLALDYYPPNLNSHLSAYWSSKLSSLFNPATLERTVNEQIERVILARDTMRLLADSLQEFETFLQLHPDLTLDHLILDHHTSASLVADAMADYDIHPDDSLRLAVEKIVAHSIPDDLEASLCRRIFLPMLHDWQNELFATGGLNTVTDLRNKVTDILNAEIDAVGIEKYLVHNLLSPLAGNPEELNWTLDDAVDAIVDSEVGQAISVPIRAQHEFITGFGVLEAILELSTAGIGLDCMYPENVRDLLETALYGHGAELNPDGLAFIELIKLYQYYDGNESYRIYEQEIETSVRAMQAKISDAFVEALEPFLAAESFAGTLDQRIEDYAESLPVEEILARAIAQSLLAILEDAGLDTRQSVRDLMHRFHFYLDASDMRNGEKLATIADLLDILVVELQQENLRVHQFIADAKAQHDYLKAAGRRVFTQMVRDRWGQINLDIRVRSAIEMYIANQMDLAGTIGNGVENLLGGLFDSGQHDIPDFLGLLSLGRRVSNGDCIAKWQSVLLSAAAMAEILWQFEFAASLFSAEAALGAAYDEAFATFTHWMIQEFVKAILEERSGDYGSWMAPLHQNTILINWQELTDLTPAAGSGFIWKDRVGIVVREHNNLINPRCISLLLFDPFNPTGTKREYLLGNWGNVDNVHAADGMVMIGGSEFIGSELVVTALFVSIQDNTIEKFPLQRGRALTISSAEHMITINNGQHMALSGSAGITLLPRPVGANATVLRNTAKPVWSRYE